MKFSKLKIRICIFNPNFYIYFKFTNQNLFIAKATPTKSNNMNELSPSYYKKGIYMKKWFIISNIGELATTLNTLDEIST